MVRLAELELLRLYHNPASIRGRNKTNIIKNRVREHCKEIVTLKGFDSFHVFSTRRQFIRYKTWWKSDQWQDVADTAVKALLPPGESGDDART